MSVSMKIVGQCIVACLIRIWLLTSEYRKQISDRVEVSTPLNSWKRVTEGVYLLNENANPYEGDLVHEPPLNLYIYKYLIHYSQTYLPCIFVLCDIITALLLYMTANKYLHWSIEQQNIMLKANAEFLENSGKKGKSETENKTSQSSNMLLKDSDIVLPPSYVFAAYLFNPYVIFNCVAMTTTVFSNVFLALYLCAMVHRKIFVSCVSLAICTTQLLYSVILICPIILILRDERHLIRKVITYTALFILILAGLTCLSSFICGGWKFIENTYGFILLVPDLRPNIGLFWYFFTEMFEHFRALFISAFQINVLFLYLIPLSIRFRKDSVLLAVSLIILTSVFKSYPSLGDIGFCLALLPIWTHLFSYLQQSFLVGCCFLITTVLGPVVWHLWIYARSANANFYFGVTLSFATAQIFLITDLLFAYIKREFWLKNNHIGNTDSDKAKLTLE